MEHLNEANTNSRYSLFGWIITNLSGVLGVITASDVLVYVSIGTGLLTMAFTIDKWVLMRKKGKNIDNN